MKNKEKLAALVQELQELQKEEMYIVIKYMNNSTIEGSISNISKNYVRLSDAEGNEHAAYIPTITNISY
jgi:hypothetical protein